MDRHDDPELNRDIDTADTVDRADDGETHATTGGAAAAGAVTGGVVGLAGGPIGAAIGAVGGAIIGAAAERMMHSDDDSRRAEAGLDNDRDRNPLIENRAEADARSGAGAAGAYDATRPPDTYDTARTTGAYETTGTTGTTDTARASAAYDATRTAESTRGEQTMQLREEELQARKTPVETGQVNLGKDVVEEQKTMDVPVSREEAVIERHPVERRPSDAPVGSGRDREVEVPVREEQVNVEKRPVVYEEVGVDKREVTETRPVSETVRREEARIDREGQAAFREEDDADKKK